MRRWCSGFDGETKRFEIKVQLAFAVNYGLNGFAYREHKSQNKKTEKTS